MSKLNEAQPLFPQETTAKPQVAVKCLGMTFESDEARRAYFLEKLREKLKDPEFCRIEGFPLGSDEDILALPTHRTTPPAPIHSLRISSSITGSSMTTMRSTVRNPSQPM